VEFFSRTGDIDLYGVGWNRPSRRVGKTWMPFFFRRIGFNLIEQWQRIRPDPRLVAARRAYKGTAESKSETLGQYTFAICFENMILKGWITEKIFDCFFAGTIPVYWGASDIQEHIPPECFIDMRQFSNYDELKDYLKLLSQAQIDTYRESARAFINSPGFYPFSKDAFAQLFLRIVEEDAGMTLSQA
jgi:hypothetical protein